MKQDFYSTCNPNNTPDFDGRFCTRCAQSECKRSVVGKTSFGDRVANWEERLFTSPSSLPEDDPRYKEISGKKFVSLNVVQGQTAQWVDTSRVEEAASQAPEIVPQAEILKASEPSVIKQEPFKAVIPAKNTPVKGRQMLSGEAVAPVLDPWQPKQPLKPGDQLVSKGAKIKL